MKVNIDEIEKITLLLLSKLKESEGKSIELNNDFIGIFLRMNFITHMRNQKILH